MIYDKVSEEEQGLAIMNTSRNSAYHGFTLVELLVVVAIIGILASIALPNYQHSLVKARATAVLAEMKSLGTALEAYQLDYNAYPRDGNDTLDREEELFNSMRILSVLTSPTAYISEIPDDLFHTEDFHADSPVARRYFPERPPFPYAYMSKGNVVDHRGSPRGYFLFSIGPDKWFDSAGSDEDSFLVYHPSNGIVSNGDILFKGF